MHSRQANSVYSGERNNASSGILARLLSFQGQDWLVRTTVDILGHEYLCGRNNSAVMTLNDARGVFGMFNGLTAFSGMDARFVKIGKLIKSIWSGDSSFVMKLYEGDSKGTQYTGIAGKIVGIVHEIFKIIGSVALFLAFEVCAPIRFIERHCKDFLSPDVKKVGQIQGHVFCVLDCAEFGSNFCELIRKSINGDKDVGREVLGMTKSTAEIIGGSWKTMTGAELHPIIGLACATVSAVCGGVGILYPKSEE